MLSPEDVDIYPLHEFDRAKDVEAMHMAWVFGVNDCLDPEILRTSLSRLLQIGDWRKFAGRFKRNKDGKLELHTPRSFLGGYSIIGYSHRDLSDQKESDHELVSQMSTGQNLISLHAHRPSYLEFQCHSDTLANGTITTWIQEQLPPLALHITTFKGTTIVSLLWRHIIADGGGMADLMHAWSLVLAGREDDVPPLLGTTENIVWQIGEKANEKGKEEWCMKGKSLGLWAMCRMFLRVFLWRRFTVQKFEARCISVPGRFVEQLKERASMQLEVKGIQSLPFILSNSLILRAWFLRKALEAEPGVSNVLLAMPVNPRLRLSELQQKKGVYVQNMLSWVFMSLSVETIRGPLAILAMEIRRQTQEQATPAQITAYFDFKHAQAEKRIPTEKLHYFTENPGNDFLVAYNDLTVLDVREKADFGPAVARQGNLDSTRVNAPCTPTIFMQKRLGISHTISGQLRLPYIVCSGRDAFGNYILDGVLSRHTWDLIEQGFECSETI
ncbi:uncharacterized protein GIQ15_03338 [Arthroderma uncinatum]|uniref:uncharacterized protein n=1 Tax=Arthroderma uncinatum TaxID=74035 RepID=UPI00144AE2D2|nr:uncharacterized protein GIQ15_03338 [Arthroderma uncinatum]KAF3484014.1 hypothetical protein GIQ15_03338 [Arthroderma uncinatum]